MAAADVVPNWEPWVAVDAFEDPPSDALCRLRAGAERDRNDDDEEEQEEKEEEEGEEKRGTERSWTGERDERNDSEADRAYRLERRNGSRAAIGTRHGIGTCGRS